MSGIVRKCVTLGVDMFCIDSDGKVYRNGFGRVMPREYLIYNSGSKREKILFAPLFDYLHKDDLDPAEAVRRTKIFMSGAHENIKKAQAKRRKEVYCITTRRKFKSLTDASQYYGLAKSSIHQGIREKRTVRGLKFRYIS